MLFGFMRGCPEEMEIEGAPVKERLHLEQHVGVGLSIQELLASGTGVDAETRQLAPQQLVLGSRPA